MRTTEPKPRCKLARQPLGLPWVFIRLTPLNLQVLWGSTTLRSIRSTKSSMNWPFSSIRAAEAW